MGASEWKGRGKPPNGLKGKRGRERRRRRRRRRRRTLHPLLVIIKFSSNKFSQEINPLF
jgi:hypothetical protein